MLIEAELSTSSKKVPPVILAEIRQLPESLIAVITPVFVSTRHPVDDPEVKAIVPSEPIDP